MPALAGVANRTSSRGEIAVALAGPAGRVVDLDAVAGADLVVNATPIGMVDDALPLDPERLGQGQLVADLVYHPIVTPLLGAADAHGAAALNGLGMPSTRRLGRSRSGRVSPPPLP